MESYVTVSVVPARASAATADVSQRPGAAVVVGRASMDAEWRGGQRQMARQNTTRKTAAALPGWVRLIESDQLRHWPV